MKIPLRYQVDSLVKLVIDKFWREPAPSEKHASTPSQTEPINEGHISESGVSALGVVEPPKAVAHKRVAQLKTRENSFIDSSPCLDTVTEANQHDLANALEMFANWPMCFTINEFKEWVDADIGIDKLRQELQHDQRFILLESPETVVEQFVPESALRKWWMQCNFRLALAGHSKLGSRQLAIAMTSILPESPLDRLPERALEYGYQRWLINLDSTGQFFFPLAHLLSYLPTSLIKRACLLVDKLTSSGLLGRQFTKARDEAFKEALSVFDQRELAVLNSREGLNMESKSTLQQIGITLGITRERVRQIEERIWERLNWPSRSMLLLEALLCDVFSRGGSLITAKNDPATSVRKLAAKCLGIPLAELPQGELWIIGCSLASLKALQAHLRSANSATEKGSLDRIMLGTDMALGAKDVEIVAKRIAPFYSAGLNRSQRAYLALRHIGKPAHFREIAEVYNSLFPEHDTTEHNVHAVLGREQLGVVWLGIRGTYALKEWGYERPSETLFDTVTEIVQKGFSESGRAVTFQHIVVEVARYRKVVNQNSVMFASYFNPRLRRVSKDSFVPQEWVNHSSKDITQDELDRVLREFEESQAHSRSTPDGS